MNPARFILLVVAITSIAGAPAHAQTSDRDTVVYTMDRDSNFEWGCFAPCLCPVLIREPVQGAFTLIKTGSDPLFDHYSVTDVNWKAPDGTTPLVIRGSGTYRRGGEVALQEQLTLDLSFNGGESQRFDSGLVPPQAPFPEIHIAIRLHGDVCFDSGLVVVAKPLGPVSVDAGPAADLLNAVPTPFRTSTEVEFSLTREGPIDLGVFDVTGREVCSLARGEWFAAGRHRRTWDARLSSGRTAPPGLYLIRLSTVDGLFAREIVRLR